MLDHIGLAVTSFDQAKDFYSKALAPLGLRIVMEATKEQTGSEEYAGFGEADKSLFWIGTGGKPKGGIHVAFVAATRKQVDAFYAAAITAGGRDNGKPGLRPHYHAGYYAAFILDRDGNNIEAVCHAKDG